MHKTNFFLQLATDISESKAMSSLKEAEDLAQKVVRSTKSDQKSQEHQEALALSSRLKFYRHFFQTLSLLNKQEITDAMRHINSAKDQIPTLRSTLDIGKDCIGFEPMVNQRLLPPTFPRYTEIRTKEATIDYLDTLLDRLITATQVSQLGSYLSALVRYLRANSMPFFSRPGY